MVTPCISDIQHFIVQLMRTTLENVELLKNLKLSIPSHSAQHARLTGHNMQP